MSREASTTTANADIGVIADIITLIGGVQQLPIIDVFGSMTPGDLEPDGLHPGEQGHQRLYSAIESWHSHCRP